MPTDRVTTSAVKNEDESSTADTVKERNASQTDIAPAVSAEDGQ